MRIGPRFPVNTHTYMTYKKKTPRLLPAQAKNRLFFVVKQSNATSGNWGEKKQEEEKMSLAPSSHLDSVIVEWQKRKTKRKKAP